MKAVLVNNQEITLVGTSEMLFLVNDLIMWDEASKKTGVVDFLALNPEQEGDVRKVLGPDFPYPRAD